MTNHDMFATLHRYVLRRSPQLSRLEAIRETCKLLGIGWNYNSIRRFLTTPDYEPHQYRQQRDV